MTTPSLIAITDAIVATLQAAPAVAQGRVFAVIPSPAAASLDHVVVAATLAAPRPGGLAGSPIDWDTQVQIVCESRFGIDNESPHVGVTRLAADVFARLFENEALGGASDGLLPGPVSFSYADAERQIAVCTMTLTVMHRTNYGEM